MPNSLPTSTEVTVDVSTQYPKGAGAMAVLVAEKSQEADLPAAERAAAMKLLQSGVATGKAREVQMEIVPAGKEFRRLFVVGLGDALKVNAETLRGAGGAIQRAARRQKQGQISVAIPHTNGISTADAAEAIVSGFLLASFDFREFKGSAAKDKSNGDDAAPPQAVRLTLITQAGHAADVKKAIARGQAIADAQNFCRTIASRPGNVINPPALAKVAQQAAAAAGLKVRIIDEKEMQRLGMGGILAVGNGSQKTPPRLIVLEHRPASAKNVQPLLAVGKAITFDTGGISIKPADKMGAMIYDKSGGTAVLGFMVAVARLKLPIPIIGILSSAENHISETAYRPGDILKMYNGVTVEVTNTDAEGRLVLGDALAWGIETFKPAAVVNLATLTGACVVALGNTMAGLMSNDDALSEELISAGKAVGEQMWRLPIGDDQRNQMKSQSADIVNSAGRGAGVLQGGAFLSYFIPRDPPVPWVHLDIAGVMEADRELPYYGKGSMGWGVRTLIEWSRRRAESENGSPARRNGRAKAKV